MTPKIKLSILDQSPIRKYGTARQAITETTELARLADELGYTRFWVSEHHNFASLAGSSPEVLIAHLASHTKNIRLGSGGVMLPNHSALKMAESFRLLETLSPGRIDMGIGRAPGGDRLTSLMLNPSNTFDEHTFIQQLADVQHYLADVQTMNRRPGSVLAIPVAPTAPELWLLTSSGGSAMIAAHFGLAVSFAQFIAPLNGPEVIRTYREHFRPSDRMQEPRANFAVFVICAATEEKVEELKFTTEYQMLQFEKGIFNGYPPFGEIRDYRFSAAETERITYHNKRMVWGTPDQVKSKLTALAGEYGVDEIIAVTITYSFEDRITSYRLLAEAFQLENRN